MPRSARINQLKELIQKLFEESSLIDLKNPKLTAEQYLQDKHKLQSLKNLIAIARNELNSLMYQYRYTIAGKVIGDGGEIKEQVVRSKIYSEVDIGSYSSVRNRKTSIIDHDLIEVIKKDYSTYFIEGTLELKRIKKVA